MRTVMKRLDSLTRSAAVLFLAAACAAAPRSELRMFDGRGYVPIADSEAARVSQLVERVLASCDYEAPPTPGIVTKWEGYLRAPHAHAAYDPPLRVRVAGQPLDVDEILVEFPRDGLADYVLVRSGAHIRAFTKAAPEATRELRWVYASYTLPEPR